MCLFCSTYYKAVRVGGGDSGGHVLRETTSRGLYGLIWPSLTSERWGEGDCTALDIQVLCDAALETLLQDLVQRLVAFNFADPIVPTLFLI